MNNKRSTGVDILGKRYGRLIAVEFRHYNEKFQDCWLFSCDCGNEKVMPACNVKWGRVRSCGCLAKEHIESLRRKDIKGKKYGRLTAIEPTDKRTPEGSIIWKCRCDCGKIIFYSVNRLTQGRTRSCGCLYAETRGSCAENRKDAIEKTLISSLVASKKPRADNSSGHTGVCYDKRRDNWMAYIDFKKKRIYLGAFKEKREAIRKRKEAEARLHDSIIIENRNRLSEKGKEKWEAYLSREVSEKG